MTKTNKTALIIGASRGLGYGLVKEYLSRGWDVIGTERKSNRGFDSQLKTIKNSALQIEQLDMNNPEEIGSLKQKLKGKKLDLLFVNAGVMDQNQTIGEVSTEEFNRLMVTNALSPMRVIESLDELVESDGCIAVMSSGLASVGDNETGSMEVYRASKAALNTLMRSYAVRAGKDRSLFAIVPGWVKTDMGGAEAPLDVETSVKGIAKTIEARSGNPCMLFVDYQNKIVTW
jgi:NAD(P)-dependent dehydrogenase (short-subunit alcohol dehydrogenase family)